MTLTYNESKMIPFIMPYYERLGFDKLVVYDNESTDNTIELLKQYPFVEIRTFKTKGKNNRVQSELKTNFVKKYQKQTDVWLYISDFDEVIYYNGDFKKYLQEKDSQGYTYLNQIMIELITDKFPNNLAHENCEIGHIWKDISGGAKMTLFKPNKIKNIKYGIGAHTVEVSSQSLFKSLNHQEIKSFHIKYIDYNYCYERTKLAKERRSQEDIKRKFGTQYNIENFKNEWEKRKQNSISINDYMNNNYEIDEKYERDKIITTSIWAKLYSYYKK